MTSTLLVTMPWAGVDVASAQLGLLKAIARRAGHRADDLYANLALLEWLDIDLYTRIAQGDVPVVTGEWLFAPHLLDAEALKRRPEIADSTAYLDFLAGRGRLPADIREKLIRLRREVVPAFLDRLIASVSWGDYDVVGFSCVFSQIIPSVALAKRIKEVHPDGRILLGGAQCDAPMGQEYVRAMRWVDWAAVGPADHTLPALLDDLAAGGDGRNVPGLVRRDDKGRAVMTGPHRLVSLDELPVPDYDTYFARGAKMPMKPWIAIEASRGCWWGQKSQCTFCGISPLTMPFYAKSAERVLREMEALSERYRVLDFCFTDYIMDHRYFKTLLPELERLAHGWVCHFEIKANVTRDHVRQLSRAGVRRVQPGIESFSTEVLKLMRKGCTATQNIQLLKWCEEFGIQVSYNILWGFPGETADDYQRLLATILKLRHFQPPVHATEIAIHRYSPLFAGDPEMGLEDIRPRDDYSFIFDADAINIPAVAYEHDATDLVGMDERAPLYAEIQAALAAWRAGYHAGRYRMEYRTGPGFLTIEDRRDGNVTMHTLDRIAKAVYLACVECAKTPHTVARDTRAARIDIGEGDVADLLAQLDRLGVVFEENGQYFALALPHPLNREDRSGAASLPGVRTERPQIAGQA
jgi:ribosomal peptide maturation radical SAM protein 1